MDISALKYLRDHEQISECIERMKDYAEDSIPVLDENDEILGVITSCLLYTSSGIHTKLPVAGSYG